MNNQKYNNNNTHEKQKQAKEMLKDDIHQIYVQQVHNEFGDIFRLGACPI